MSQSLHATTNSPLLLPEPFNHLEKSRILNNHWKNICPQRRISETSNERSKRNNLIQPILVLPLFSSVVIAQRFIGKKHSPNLCPPRFPFFVLLFFSFFLFFFLLLISHPTTLAEPTRRTHPTRSQARLAIEVVVPASHRPRNKCTSKTSFVSKHCLMAESHHGQRVWGRDHSSCRSFFIGNCQQPMVMPFMYQPKRCTDRLFKLVICEAEVAAPLWSKLKETRERCGQDTAILCLRAVSCVLWLLPFPSFARHSIRIFYLSSWEMKAKNSSTRSTKWMQWRGISVASPDSKSWAIRWNEVSRILVNITRCLWKFVLFFFF